MTLTIDLESHHLILSSKVNKVGVHVDYNNKQYDKN